MISREEAKNALDSIIKKARVHLYKPIQIAEILYRDRVFHDIDLLNLQTYRNQSKKWRDDISEILLGTTCTSSARFQDDLFNENAMPPRILYTLGKENCKSDGAVEAYIYKSFQTRHRQLKESLDYCLNNKKETFELRRFLAMFWREPGLKRSIDKIYEIVVFALFSTLVNALNLKVQISIDDDQNDLLHEFEEFAKKVMVIDFSNPIYVQDAKIYRLGVTNASDRGLDMYANWGPAIQVKHLTLDLELAESIVINMNSDRIIIVCKDAEKDIILSLLKQIGWTCHIQSIVTENDLILWYDKALHGKFSDVIGDRVLAAMALEIQKEFPSTRPDVDFLRKRGYEALKDSFWLR